MTDRKKRQAFRVGIALGSGSSRGWSHIGILRALAEQGIEPDVTVDLPAGADLIAPVELDDLTWRTSDQ